MAAGITAIVANAAASLVESLMARAAGIEVEQSSAYCKVSRRQNKKYEASMVVETE